MRSQTAPRVAKGGASDVRGQSLKGKDEGKGLVDGAQLGEVQASHRRPEPLGIYDRRLLCEHACLGALQLDRRTEAGGTCPAGSRRDEDRAQAHELVGLNDYGVARPSLLVPASRAWRGETEDLAANHVTEATLAVARPSAPEQLASRRGRSRPPQAFEPPRQSRSACVAWQRSREALCAPPPSRSGHLHGRRRARRRTCHRGGRGASEPRIERSTNCATDLIAL
jgi:hypothetical protein